MKICPKCNSTLPDGAAFCNNCGTNLSAPFEEDAIPADALSGNAIFEEAKEKNKHTRIGIIAVAGAAALLILILIIIIASNASAGSYKTPLKEYTKLMTKGSTELEPYLYCFLPEFAVDTYGDLHSLAAKVMPDETADYDKSLVYLFEDAYSDIKDDYGKKYKVTYEIRDKEKLSKSDLKDIEDVYEDLYDSMNNSTDFSDENYYDEFAAALEKQYGIEVSDKDKRSMQKTLESFMKEFKNIKIQAGYEVEVKVTIEGSDSRESEKIDLKIIKVNGRWIIDPESSSSLSSFCFSESIDSLF